MSPPDTQPLAPLEPPRIASSLETATAASVLLVDSRGRTRTALYHRLLVGGWLAAMAGLVAYLGVTTGPAGALLGGAALGFGFLRVRHYFSLRRGVALLVAGRLDEAEADFARAARGFLVPRAYRGFAEHRRAQVWMLRGDHERALAHLVAARAHLARAVRHGYGLRAVEYAECTSLVSLGRVTEARRRLDGLPRFADEGDFLRFGRWHAELYVALGEGQHAFSDEELHLRAKAALAITLSAPLLGLLAWAHAHLGDRQMAAHLLAEAADRPKAEQITNVWPLLGAWMAGYAAQQ